MYYKGEGDWAKVAGLKTEDDEKIPQSVQFAKALGIEKATVRRYRGLEKVEEFEYEKNSPTPIKS